MSGWWKAFILVVLLFPLVSAPGCGPGKVSEEDAAGRDADLGNEDDGGFDAASAGTGNG